MLATIRERKGAIEQDSISNSTSKSTSSTSNSISEKMLRLVSAVRGEMSIRDMMEVMGMKSRPMFLNNYLTPALKAELLERTQPDSPNLLSALRSGIAKGAINRRTKQEQSQACLSYALQEGGRR